MNPRITRFPPSAHLGKIQPMATRLTWRTRLWRWLTGYHKSTWNHLNVEGIRRGRR